MTRILAVALVLSLSTGQVHAEPATVGRTVNEKDILKAAVVMLEDQALQPSPSRPPGFDDWSARLERATDGRRQGLGWLLSGIGVAAAGALLLALNRVDPLSYSPPENEALGVIGLVAGAGVAGYGGFRFAKAGSEIRSLGKKDERRAIWR